MNDASGKIIFGDLEVRRVWDTELEKLWFSIVDIVSVLTEQPDRISAGVYCRKLKERLLKEGNQTVTNCHGLKMVKCV